MSDKVIVIHQPDFMPYLGFFHRLLVANLFVILDNVQFLRGSKSWHRRDKIKTPKGEEWITVGVKKSCRDIAINEVLLNDDGWRQKNINLIKENYRKAPYHLEILPHIEEIYSFQCEKMADFNMNSIYILMQLFDIKIDIVLASSLSPEGTSNDLLVDILKKVEATTYLSGIGAQAYFDPAPFDQANTPQ